MAKKRGKHSSKSKRARFIKRMDAYMRNLQFNYFCRDPLSNSDGTQDVYDTTVTTTNPVARVAIENSQELFMDYAIEGKFFWDITIKIHFKNSNDDVDIIEAGFPTVDRAAFKELGGHIANEIEEIFETAPMDDYITTEIIALIVR